MTEANSPLAQVQRHIAEAAEAASRRATDVTLLAVGKRQSPAAIRTLFEQGQRAFGENYVQEALPKQAWQTSTSSGTSSAAFNETRLAISPPTSIGCTRSTVPKWPNG
jgi:hypothetical protein